jgi:polynucleotide 5'-triphosphatase
LNGQVTATHPGNPAAKGRVPIQYLHRRETDKFYDLPQAMLNSLPAIIRERVNPRQVKIRVSYDQKTNNILAKIVKARIADLSIYNPQSDLDCRISVNFEMRFDGDVEEIIAAGVGERHPDRHKDRLSYTQGPYQVDLTQVTQNISANVRIDPHILTASLTIFQQGNNRIDKEHELEIEVSTEAVRNQGQRAASGQPHEYPALVEGLLNNILVLAREIPNPGSNGTQR